MESKGAGKQGLKGKVPESEAWRGRCWKARLGRLSEREAFRAENEV